MITTPNAIAEELQDLTNRRESIEYSRKLLNEESKLLDAETKSKGFKPDVIKELIKSRDDDRNDKIQAKQEALTEYRELLGE